MLFHHCPLNCCCVILIGRCNFFDVLPLFRWCAVSPPIALCVPVPWLSKRCNSSPALLHSLLLPFCSFVAVQFVRLFAPRWFCLVFAFQLVLCSGAVPRFCCPLLSPALKIAHNRFPAPWRYQCATQPSNRPCDALKM